MKKTFFISQYLLFLALAACSSEPSKELDEDVSTISFQKAPDSCECTGWLKVKSDPTLINCEDECFQLFPASDSTPFLPGDLQGVCIDFTGNFYKEPQIIGEEGESFKTFVFTGYKVISTIAKNEKAEETYSSVVSFEKIDTNNFFRSFVAYVQNGNINDMLFFYDSAYVMRHCVSALENDTARCMNEQYCGFLVKDKETTDAKACIDFIEIEKIEFLHTVVEEDDRVAYFKIISFDGRVVELRFKYKAATRNNKILFGFIGNEN